MMEYDTCFFQVAEVQLLLQYITEQGTFSLHTLKRGVSQYVRQRMDPSRESSHEMRKPDGLSVTDMFDPLLFQPGSFALHSESYTLRPRQMESRHCSACARCKAAGTVQPDCYFSRMLRCITHGWHPPCDYANIAPCTTPRVITRRSRGMRSVRIKSCKT
jgi:hypothetical protein